MAGVMTEMTITEALLDSVVSRLQDAHGAQLDIQWYPQAPGEFHLAHPVGAVLVGYAGSRFGSDAATDATWVERELTIPLTLVFTQLHGADGVIGWLDRLRQTLIGFTPAHCDTPLRPLDDGYLGQSPGIWQYVQTWTTRTVEVQVPPPLNAALLNPFFEEDES